jgi:hypothetical protein
MEIGVRGYSKEDGAGDAHAKKRKENQKPTNVYSKENGMQ